MLEKHCLAKIFNLASKLMADGTVAGEFCAKRAVLLVKLLVQLSENRDLILL